MQKLTALFAGLSVLIVLGSGCSVSDKRLGELEKKISVLKSKGVPDSVLSQATVALYDARYAKQKDDNGRVRSAAKTAHKEILRAEAFITEMSTQLNPQIASLKNDLATARQELNGMHLRRIDSVMQIADSFSTMGWVLNTYEKLKVAADMLPNLKICQARATEIKPQLIGSWQSEQRSKHESDKSVNAIETNTFTFKPDGKGSLVQQKKGLSNPRLKEDWEFISSGNYDIIGDTVWLFVDRFNASRQNFEEKYRDENGKETWKKRSDPTYDSVITDGSQDRFVTFTDLKQDFKKK